VNVELAAPNRGTLQKDPLLNIGEPAPVCVLRRNQQSPFLITCDHAARRIPHMLGTLGLTNQDLSRHIALDIGAVAVSRLLARHLGATVVAQRYSRLVIDCNRPPRTPDSIVTLSERTPIPGNEGLSEAQIESRIDAIFRPYHAAIGALLDARQQQQQATALVAMHSFTPRFMDQDRPWQLGVLYGRDARLGQALLAAMSQENWVVGDNQPYSVSDETDYALPVHCEPRGVPCVEIEIRQDLIATRAGQQRWAARLARVLGVAAAQLGH
jgi:predicted N-formylglutamate amidohydrolase